MSEQEVFEKLVSVLDDLGQGDFARSEIRRETSLDRDLGLSSLSVVDLTLALEATFGFEEFPMQSWADAETGKGAQGFLVGSLVDMCVKLTMQG